LPIWVLNIRKPIYFAFTCDTIVTKRGKSTAQNNRGKALGKLIKYLFYIAVLVLVFLVGYSFFGDLSAPTSTITETVPMPNNG